MTYLQEWEDGAGKRKTENGKRKAENYHTPSARCAPFGSIVALGSAPLRGYGSTLGAPSERPSSPPVSEGQRKRKTENSPTAHQWCVFVYFTHFSAHFLPLYATNDVTLHPISQKTDVEKVKRICQRLKAKEY